MAEEQRTDGCACAESCKACTCNGDPRNWHGNGAANPFQTSPFAKVRPDNGPHGSLCGCQRCNHDSAGIAGSASSGGCKGVQPLATSGPALVLHSDADRREFISAGAAGGLAVDSGHQSLKQPSEFAAALPTRSTNPEAIVRVTSQQRKGWVCCCRPLLGRPSAVCCSRWKKHAHIGPERYNSHFIGIAPRRCLFHPCMSGVRSCNISAGCLAVLHMHNSCSAGCDAAEPRVSPPPHNPSLHRSLSVQRTTSASPRPGFMSFGSIVQGIRGEFSACRWSRGVLSVKGVKDMASKEWLVQLPFIALVSICSGLLGALFNALHKLLRRVGHS